MILECYHESTRLTTPSFGSDYSGTTGDPAAALAGEDDGSSSDAPRGDPRKWHSWFRPRMLDLDPSPPTASTTDVPFTEVILPEGEDDIYLLARTIVKRDPPKGLCPSHITIHEGHIRVSREWLAKASEPEKSSDSGDATVLWTGSRKDLGLRFRVTPAPAAEMPVLVGADDKPTVIYKLAYLGQFRHFKALSSIRWRVLEGPSKGSSAGWRTYHYNHSLC